jgi:hypothetical protein
MATKLLGRRGPSNRTLVADEAELRVRELTQNHDWFPKILGGRRALRRQARPELYLIWWREIGGRDKPTLEL